MAFSCQSNEFTEIHTIFGNLADVNSIRCIQERVERVLNQASLKEPTPDRKRTIFDKRRVPNCELTTYVNRIVKYMELGVVHVVYAAYYLDKYLERCNVSMCCSNVHRLTAATFLTTVKFLEDEVTTNRYYATVFGLSLEETNAIERVFIHGLGWLLWTPEARVLGYLVWENSTFTVCPPWHGKIQDVHVDDVRGKDDTELQIYRQYLNSDPTVNTSV